MTKYTKYRKKNYLNLRTQVANRRRGSSSVQPVSQLSANHYL